MPELPEAERARRQLERVVGRGIVAVDNAETYVCRPHAPGEMAAALVGHRLSDTHRRGKILWAETDGGPGLGLHLGMAGSLTVDKEPAPRTGTGSVEFDGGGRLALRDKRRLGRPCSIPTSALGRKPPRSAARSSARASAAAPRLKARLLDQTVISASATCWPTRSCGARDSEPGASPESSTPPSSRLRPSPAPPCATRSGSAERTPEPHLPPRARRPLPSVRDRARARNDGRGAHVLVPCVPAMKVRGGSVRGGRPRSRHSPSPSRYPTVASGSSPASGSARAARPCAGPC